MPLPRPRFEIFVYALKNAVIVPVGAKGGFVVKAAQFSQAQPSQAQPGPADVEACYPMFISGLLDVTDNMVNG